MGLKALGAAFALGLGASLCRAPSRERCTAWLSREDVPAFSALSAAKLRAASVPCRSLPADAAGREDLLRWGGHHSFALQAIAKDAPVTRAALEKVHRLSLGVPVGYRAVSVPIGASGDAGLRAGDRCDVVAVLPAGLWEGDPGRRVAVTLLQAVRVLQASTQGPRGAYAVLAVNPREANYLLLAQRDAKLSVSRRAPEDREVYPMETASFRKLFR